MNTQETMHNIDWRKLRDFSTEALEKVGVLHEDAVIITDTLIEADLRGVDTHGVANMLSRNVKMLAMGNMNPRPNLTIVRESPMTAVIEADDGIGNLVCVRTTEIAIQKARSSGIGMVGVKNSTHCGAMAYYPMMALKHDMIGIMTTNAAPVAPAYGGITRMFSTNPYAVAVPAGDELPVVIDMATTTVAQAKIFYKARLGEKMPLGWGLNKYGEPTEDPNEVLNGGFLTWMGGHKGYALAVLANILSGVLTGSPFGRHDFPPYRTPEHVDRKVTEGHFILAFRIDNFIPVDEFKSRMDEMIRQIKSSEPAKGFDRVYLPGEPEFEEKEKRLKTGVIPVNQPNWEALIAVRKEFGLSTSLE